MTGINLKKGQFGVVETFLLALLLMGCIAIIYRPLIREREEYLIAATMRWHEANAMLGAAKHYDEFWEKLGIGETGPETDDAAMNRWVNGIVAFAKTEGIVIDKLEPLVVETKKNDKEQKIEILLNGETDALLKFMFYLTQQEPVTDLERLTLTREPDGPVFEYRMTLVRRAMG